MNELADGVWMLKGFPPHTINVYLIDDVLIDAGTVLAGPRILRQLKGRDVKAHALTHAHIDHFGASHHVCKKLDIPLWCGELDTPAMESGKMVAAHGPDLKCAPGHPVDRPLREGDTVGSFRVLEVPGHSPGHVAYWRESDRTLVCGDVMWGYNPFLQSGDIREPFTAFSPDPQQNRESARRLAALEPELICFGHGKPVRDPERFAAAVERL